MKEEIESACIISRKAKLRKRYLQKREGLKSSIVEAKSKYIQEKVLQLPQVKIANSLFSYIDFKNEVKTRDIIIKFLNSGKAVYVPKIDTNGLEMVRINSLSELKPNSMGILEPDSDSVPETSCNIDIVIVPGILFDIKGYRIGFGRGYYDRLLSKIDGLKIGLCYEFQLKKEIPHSIRDIPVDILVTEKKIIFTKE